MSNVSHESFDLFKEEVRKSVANIEKNVARIDERTTLLLDGIQGNLSGVSSRNDVVFAVTQLREIIEELVDSKISEVGGEQEPVQGSVRIGVITKALMQIESNSLLWFVLLCATLLFLVISNDTAMALVSRLAGN